MKTDWFEFWLKLLIASSLTMALVLVGYFSFQGGYYFYLQNKIQLQKLEGQK